MHPRMLTYVPLLLLCLGVSQAEEQVTLQGKRRTGRAIALEATVKASPDESVPAVVGHRGRQTLRLS